MQEILSSQPLWGSEALSFIHPIVELGRTECGKARNGTGKFDLENLTNKAANINNYEFVSVDVSEQAEQVHRMHTIVTYVVDRRQ